MVTDQGRQDPYICMGVFDGDDPPACDDGAHPKTTPMTPLYLNCTEGPLPAGKLTWPADEKACDGTVECWTNPRTHMFGQDACCCKTAEQKASDPSYKCQTSDEPQHNSAACTVHSNTNCTLDDDQWHMLTLTTNQDGPGWRLYIDGVLRASYPNLGPGTKFQTPEQNHVHGGSPIDPNSTINLCGRDVSGWKGGSGKGDGTDGWSNNLYFLGKIAHFAIVSDALSEQEVQILFDAYQKQFGFDKN